VRRLLLESSILEVLEEYPFETIMNSDELIQKLQNITMNSKETAQLIQACSEQQAKIDSWTQEWGSVAKTLLDVWDLLQSIDTQWKWSWQEM